jgi:hypothetical protein
MKSIKTLLISLTAVAVVFAFSQSALAALGSQGGAGGDNSITVVKDAPGTKYVGPLTTYVIQNPNYVPGAEPQTETEYLMYFFLRLKKGMNLYAFSGIRGLTDKNSVSEMQTTIHAFIADTVIPILYHDYAPDFPEFWIKAVDNIAEDELPLPDEPYCCNAPNGLPMQISIMDVTIAVQD